MLSAWVSVIRGIEGGAGVPERRGNRCEDQYTSVNPLPDMMSQKTDLKISVRPSVAFYVRRLDFDKADLHVGTLQITYRETSLGSLSPALLIAVTLN